MTELEQLLTHSLTALVEQSEQQTALINALDAHTEMSSQALNSQEIQTGLKEILLGPAKLYEKLRTSA